MLRRTDLRVGLPAPATLRDVVPRADVDVDAVAHLVAPVIVPGEVQDMSMEPEPPETESEEQISE